MEKCGGHGQLHSPRQTPQWFSGKEPSANAGDALRLGFAPWVGKIHWEGNGNPLKDSCLENPSHRGAWRVIARVATKSQTQLSMHTQVAGRKSSVRR